MAKLLHKCPKCQKTATVVSEAQIVPGLFLHTYQCGHSEAIQGIHQAETDTLDIESLDGKRLFPFQLAGAQFAEASNIRCLIADEMGLGKTPQSLAVVKAHPEVMPFIAFVKSGLKVQWNKEAVRWCDFTCQVVGDTKTQLLPGFDGYIVSMDAAWRIGYRTPTKREKAEASAVGDKLEMIKCGPDIVEMAAKCRVKLVIIDECQLIKNGTAKRTAAVRNVCKQVEHVIALSGTPIKNNAAEYFPILNILRPDKFPNQNQFVYDWCDTYFDGFKARTGGVKNAAAFLDYTKDFIIRRERKDVLPDLPLIWRQFNFCELGDMVEAAYKKEFEAFQEYYSSSEGTAAFERSSNILAYLSRMRHLAGLAKIDPVCEYVEQFIQTTDRKIMVFVHHKDVGETVRQKLANMAKEWPAEWGKGILEITSAMTSEQRDEAVTKFRSNEYRVLIGSTLASGEGLNLQFCSDCIMMERQWNPANEEQAEARFPRPGQLADKINATYFVAVGTVDEFFSELVERKREVVNKTMKGEAVKWDQSSLVRELGEILHQRGGHRWGL